jgi:hypothetical protein
MVYLKYYSLQLETVAEVSIAMPRVINRPNIAPSVGVSPVLECLNSAKEKRQRGEAIPSVTLPSEVRAALRVMLDNPKPPTPALCELLSRPR